MAYDVSLLSDYVNEQNFPLLKKAIFGAKTASIFRKQTGIKHTDAINFLEVDAVFQSNRAGDPVQGAGDVKFSQRLITVSPVAVRQYFDPRILNTKYVQSQVKAGSADNEVVFEKEITDELINKINKQLEVALWKGDTTLTDVNLNKFDGFIKVLDADTATIKLTGAASTITAANIIATVDKVYEAIPADCAEVADMAIYMGSDLYKTYVMALKNANLYHYSVDGGNEFTLPGTTTKVIALPGLNASNRIYAGSATNFTIGLDLDGEEDSVTSSYSDDTEKVKIKVAFKMGVQIAFPEQIVQYKAGA